MPWSTKVFLSLPGLFTVVVVMVCARSTAHLHSWTHWSLHNMKRSRVLVTLLLWWRSLTSDQGTLRFRSLAIPQKTRCLYGSVTAQCNDGIRRSSKRLLHPACHPSCMPILGPRRLLLAPLNSSLIKIRTSSLWRCTRKHFANKMEG
jgi:hypothetical protein